MTTCYHCGRQGTLGFAHVPEVLIDRPALQPPFTVGGWDRCTAELACLTRQRLLGRRQGRHELEAW